MILFAVLFVWCASVEERPGNPLVERLTDSPFLSSSNNSSFSSMLGDFFQEETDGKPTATVGPTGIAIKKTTVMVATVAAGSGGLLAASLANDKSGVKGFCTDLCGDCVVEWITSCFEGCLEACCGGDGD